MTKDQVEKRIRYALNCAWVGVLKEIFRDAGIEPTLEVRRELEHVASHWLETLVEGTVRAAALPLDLDSEDLRSPAPPEEDDEEAMQRAKLTVDVAIMSAQMETRGA